MQPWLLLNVAMQRNFRSNTQEGNSDGFKSKNRQILHLISSEFIKNSEFSHECTTTTTTNNSMNISNTITTTSMTTTSSTPTTILLLLLLLYYTNTTITPPPLTTTTMNAAVLLLSCIRLVFPGLVHL